MKTPIALLLIVVLTACGTTRDQRCEQYAKAYAAYQISTTVREPSQQELDYAHAAVAFLTLYCGWIKTKAVDQFGVPIITKP